MADDNVNEQKAGEVDEDPERVPSASVAADDSENQRQGKKRKADDSETQGQGNEGEMKAFPTADTPGFLVPPGPSKLAKLKMTQEEWVGMATTAATLSSTGQERLHKRLKAICEREIKLAKEITGLADVLPLHLTEENIVDMEDDSYPPEEDAESSTDDYDSPDDEDGDLDDDNEANDEEYDEGFGINLDDKKASDETETSPGEDEEGAGGSHDAPSEEAGVSREDSSESEDPGTAEDYADMHKAMALQEADFMDLDDVDDMEE